MRKGILPPEPGCAGLAQELAHALPSKNSLPLPANVTDAGDAHDALPITGGAQRLSRCPSSFQIGDSAALLTFTMIGRIVTPLLLIADQADRPPRLRTAGNVPDHATPGALFMSRSVAIPLPVVATAADRLPRRGVLDRVSDVAALIAFLP